MELGRLLCLDKGRAEGTEHEHNGDGQKYTGILLSELWKRCLASEAATSAVVTAADGSAVAVAKDDLLQCGIIVATRINGTELTKDQGAPAKLCFPAQAKDKYSKGKWVKAIKTIEFK